jgi:hypothetical protein
VALLSDRAQLNKVDTMMVKMGTTSNSEVTSRLRIGEKSSLTSSKTVGWWFLRVAATLLAALCCAGRVCAATTAASGENVSTDEVPTLESGVLYNLTGADLGVESDIFDALTTLYGVGTLLCSVDGRLRHIQTDDNTTRLSDGELVTAVHRCVEVVVPCEKGFVVPGGVTHAPPGGCAGLRLTSISGGVRRQHRVLGAGAAVSAAVMKVEERDFLVKTSLYPAGTILCKRGTKLAYVDSSGLLPSFDDGGAISEDDSCLRIETACLLAREFREELNDTVIIGPEEPCAVLSGLQGADVIASHVPPYWDQKKVDDQ